MNGQPRAISWHHNKIRYPMQSWHPICSFLRIHGHSLVIGQYSLLSQIDEQSDSSAIEIYQCQHIYQYQFTLFVVIS